MPNKGSFITKLLSACLTSGNYLNSADLYWILFFIQFEKLQASFLCWRQVIHNYLLCSFYHIMESCLCRITDLFRLEGSSWDHLVHPVCSGRVNLQQVFQDCVHLGFEHLHKDSTTAPGNLFQCLTTLQIKKNNNNNKKVLFSYAQIRFIFLICAYCLLLVGTTEKSLVPLTSLPPITC